MSEWASESGHWYTKDGTPMYEVQRADGKGMRPTTLRDARKLGLLPSVTTIIKEAAAPGLEKWKRDQILMAALTTTRRPNEDEKTWLRRIESDSYEQTRKAADRGTIIHGNVEKHFRGDVPDLEYWDWIKVVKSHVAKHCGEIAWSAEKSFACNIGFGGRVDLFSVAGNWVLDIKTKDGAEEAMPFAEHGMQLGSYRVGLGIPTARCGVLFIDRLAPSCKLVPLDETELVRGWWMFQHLLGYWFHKTGYMPHGDDYRGIAQTAS